MVLHSMRSCLIIAIALFSQAGKADIGPQIAKSNAELAVWFGPSGVEFSGTIDSEESAQMLASSVKAVRPDLNILNKGLKISPDAETPNLEDLKSVLEEIGLSTHEGLLILAENKVLLSGLTDSVISTAALKILLEPILNGRPLINRICIVNSDDLPDLKVNLTTLESQNALLDFESYPSQLESYELPGLAISKLYPMLVMVSDLSRIDGSGGTTIAPIRALPMALPAPEESTSTDPPPARPLFVAVPTDQFSQYISLPPILFSRNTYRLQTEQPLPLDDLVKQLLEPPLAGHPLSILPVRRSGGAEAFNDYLTENRANKVKELLIARGIDPTVISVLPLQSPSEVDQGEVRLRVEVPVSIDEVAPTDSSEDGSANASEEVSPPPESGETVEQ